MAKFLKTHKLSRLNEEEIENLNIPILSKEIESVIKMLPTQKTQDQMTSLVKSMKYLKKS